MKKIIKIDFDWWPYSTDGGELSCEYNVGKAGVVEIMEHAPQGEGWSSDGDRWYYDVTFKDGTMQRIFNINRVWYDKGGDAQ